MATFTSTQSGDWNDGGTWGNTSPGVKGTDWPGDAGDVANVGHSVCYNVSETNEMGAVTVTSGGDLYFSGSASTKLTLGHVNFTVDANATLNVGRSGDIIPCSYTAEIYWNTTADNARGLKGPNGTDGINFYGDGALYGSSFLGIMTNTWQGGQTFTMSGNLYDKWLAGQKVVVHKHPDLYDNYLTDLSEFTISSIWNNGGNTSILISEAAPGSSNVFNAGGRALNVSRNIKIGKLNANTTVGCLNSLRPEIDITETTSEAHVVVDNAEFTGLHNFECDTGVRIYNSVFRNGYYGCYNIDFSIFEDTIFYSTNTAIFISLVNRIDNCFILGNFYGVYNSNGLDINSLALYSNNQGFRTCLENRITGLIYSNASAIRDIEHFYDMDVRAWGNANYMQYCCECYFTNGYIGYDEYMNYKPNTNDFVFNGHNRNYVACTVVSTPMNFSNRNQTVFFGGTYFGNFDEIPNNLYVSHAHYDLSKNSTVVRSGGATESFEVTPFSNIVINKSYIIEDWYEYDLNIASELTRIVYVMGTGWTTFPRSGRLCLEACYYDQSSGCHNATIVSTGLLTQNSVWTPLQVSFTAQQSWAARYKLYLHDWESGANIFVDNQIRDEL